jgi:hypothetical protein
MREFGASALWGFFNNIDVNRTLRIAALDVAVGRIGFERVVAETTGCPALAT